MRGKKKRRVSVRHISPRWSRVLNSERRATSGWDPPLRASLPSLCRPPPPSIHLSILSSPFRVLRTSYAAMPLSKFDRTAFSVSFRPTCTSREPSLAPFHARSSTSWNGLKLGKWRAAWPSVVRRRQFATIVLLRLCSFPKRGHIFVSIRSVSGHFFFFLTFQLLLSIR